MKHLAFATLALALSSCAMADTVKQEVIGTCPKDVKTVEVFYNGNTRTPAQTLQVTDGKFSTTLNQEKNTLVTLRAGRDGIPFYADGTAVNVDFNNDAVKGSELNNKLGVINKQVDAYEKPLYEFYDSYVALRKKENPTESDKQKIKELEEKLEVLEEKADAATMEIFLANKTNLIGAVFLPNIMYELDYDVLKSILSADNELTRHPLAAPAKEYLASLALRAPGTMYKDITENDVNGNPHKLSEWVGKGKYFLIDFWASWCGPCRKEMPNVVANYAKYHPKGFEVIGLSFDSKPEAWKKAISDLKMPWIHLSDLKGWKTIASSTYGVRSIPASILIDPKGKIIAIDLRGDKLGNKLKEIYGE